MSETELKSAAKPRWWLIVVRLAVFIALALAVGSLLNHLAAALDRDAKPAGFVRGALQGALMPMSMPNLAVGRDVRIYSEHNTGVRYKLGYTVGVNVCGAIFFGILFWRLKRWRAWASRVSS